MKGCDVVLEGSDRKVRGGGKTWVKVGFKCEVEVGVGVGIRSERGPCHLTVDSTPTPDLTPHLTLPLNQNLEPWLVAPA